MKALEASFVESSSWVVRMARLVLQPEDHFAYLKKVLAQGLECYKNVVLTQGCPPSLEEISQLFCAPMRVCDRKVLEVMFETQMIFGLYWTLASLCLLRAPLETSRAKHSPDRENVETLLVEHRASCIKIVESCFIPSVGGYRACLSQQTESDSILATMNAVQCLLLLGASSHIPRDAILRYLGTLYDKDSGAFRFSVQASWLSCELDLRHVLCALVILHHFDLLAVTTHDSCSCVLPSLLFQLDVPRLTSWILNAQNLDGGFGCRSGAASHAGYTYCAVASLALLNQLHQLTPKRLAKLFW